MLDQRVEERVARRVVSLAGRPEDARAGRVDDERRDVGGELVQVPRGVDLGSQHSGQPLGRERLDDAVVQHAGRVHDGTDPLAREEVRHRVPIGDIARRDRDRRVQLRHPVRRPAATADQHQVTNTMCGNEMPRDDLTEPTGSAGDQHRSFQHNAFPGGDPGDARHEHLAAPYPQLRFGTRQHRVRQVAVGLDQREPAGVLRLSGPHQPPHRRRAQITLPRNENELLRTLGRDPFLDLREHAGGQPVRGLDRRAFRFHALHDVRRRNSLGERDRHPVQPEQRLLRGTELLHLHGSRHE